ncbi:MAG TPA: hypothetical protein VHM70_02955 [Polyangiaceae bacterium]|jgi:hypothetical protein|nr:hypothetical protein [Polyangiaceae bacterium]
MNQTTKQPLSASQAQEYVEHLINQLGLGALPEVKVQSSQSGRWRIQWEESEEEAKPMTTSQWKRWLERRFGPDLMERLETSEG